MSSMIKRQQEGSFFKAPREFKKRCFGQFPAGPRTKRRQAENRKLNKLRIDRCEIRIPGICMNRSMLTWAHSKKSRFLVTSKDWQEAAKSCISCHTYVEGLGHKKMHAVILAAIGRRNNIDTNSC